MKHTGATLRKSESWIIFMSMFNDIDWSKGEDNSNNMFLPNSLKVREDAKRFQKRRWSLLGPGDEENMVWHAGLQT